MGNFLSSPNTMTDDMPGNDTPISDTDKMETSTGEKSNPQEGEEDLFETKDVDETTDRAKEMEEFRKELAIKRAQRREILSKHAKERENLKNCLDLERTLNKTITAENEQLKELLRLHNIEFSSGFSPTPIEEVKNSLQELKDGLESLKEQNKTLRRDLAEANFSLQTANADIANLNYQNAESGKHISALKEIISVSKTMINIREGQLNELKDKLKQIEASLAERETNLLSSDLRQEYERQLQNIRSLRSLYEERARLAEVTRLHLLRELEAEKVQHLAEVNRSKELTAKVEELEAKINEMSETIDNKNDEIITTTEETQGLKAEMLTVNKLFSQMLLGFNSRQDLDKLVARLEENHGLLSHMVLQENSPETSSALPKLLLEMVNQIDEATVKENDGKSAVSETDDCHEVKEDEGCIRNNEITSSNKDPDKQLNTTAKEIVENLPKVWRVLMELLSHQTITNEMDVSSSTCYKSVETPSGPVLVPSVSQTYIRLKDLIVEKLSLIKEVKKMKRLNLHLETRLEEQERRLCLVTSELGKTWHVVSRLRRHHHQLHTHEKILRYELQQKRKMLNELKEELEYCKEKWDKAREKNDASELEWKKLRAEFSSRRNRPGIQALNTSAESGYSDERHTETSSESNDESECLNRSRNLRRTQKLSLDARLDSSAELNLVAEREDPISDMLDVADLPLDSQDVDTSGEVACDLSQKTDTGIVSACENSISEDIPIHESTISPNEEPSEGMTLPNNNDTAVEPDENIPSLSESIETKKTNTLNINLNDIRENIQKQNERLAKRDERLNILEENAKQLSEATSKTFTTSKHLCERMDQIHERSNVQASSSKPTTSEINDVHKEGSPSTSTAFQDHEARYKAREERLQRLEEQTKSLVNKVRGTKDKRIKIKYKLEELHNIYGSDSASSRNASPGLDDERESNECSISEDDTLVIPNVENDSSVVFDKSTNNSQNEEIELSNPKTSNNEAIANMATTVSSENTAQNLSKPKQKADIDPEIQKSSHDVATLGSDTTSIQSDQPSTSSIHNDEDSLPEENKIETKPTNSHDI